MSSYFDAASHFVSQVSKVTASDEEFLSIVADHEDTIIQWVSLLTGDREFPEDLRQKIQGIIAVKRLRGPGNLGWNERIRGEVASCRLSPLISDLHSAFHEVAGRQIQTRFGLIFDNPEESVRHRDQHDVGLDETERK